MKEFVSAYLGAPFHNPDTRMKEFVNAYLGVPYSNPDGLRIDEAAQEYIRRVEEYELLYPMPYQRGRVAKFARAALRDICLVRSVDFEQLRKRIYELQR
jgi:hypothetical protein